MASAARAELTDEVAGALRRYVEEAAALDQVIAERAGIALTDLHCLTLLERHGGSMTAGTLAELSRLTTGAVTGVINRLERAGLARRTADPHDGRRVIVEVQGEAARRGRELLSPRAQAHAGLLEDYDAEQLSLLRDLLRAAVERTHEQAVRLRTQGT